MTEDEVIFVLFVVLGVFAFITVATVGLSLLIWRLTEKARAEHVDSDADGGDA